MLHFCKDFGKYSPFLQNVPFSPKSTLPKGTLCHLQGRSQDVFRGTHNSPNRFAPVTPYPLPPPPPPIKTFLIKGLAMLSLSLFLLMNYFVGCLGPLTDAPHSSITQ